MTSGFGLNIAGLGWPYGQEDQPVAMKIEDKVSIGRMRSVAPASPGSRAEIRPVESQPVTDVATVFGIPETEFTPKVRQAIMGLLAEVDALRRELKETKSRIGYLEKLADEDTLVPVVNRRAFVRELSRVMNYARRYEVPCSVIYFDVNGMKVINDRYGHSAGDAALAHVAETLVANVRDSDVVGRLGGDEFGVILVHSDEKVAAEKGAFLADKIAQAPLNFQGNAISIQVAYGSYQFRPDEDADRALDAADKAMYAHKTNMNAGRQSGTKG